ncbi:MAG: hypothetical protein ABSG06_09070, partial [Methanoregula sp.]
MANPVCFTSPPSGITCPTNPAPLYPANPAPAYNYYSSGNLFLQGTTGPYCTSSPNNVTPSNPSSALPSYPTPLQGEFLPNCPFIAALQSLAWVNRNFIISNITGPNSGPGNYSVTFWNYPNTSYSNFSQQVSLSQNVGGSQINSGWGNPVSTTVVVNGTIALNGSNQMVDPKTNMSYGAGSRNSNEIWPALYEKAYAKFILYQYGAISASQLQSTSADPLFCQVCCLTSVQWGGNAGIALAYLTGLPCYSYSTASSSFSPMGNLNCSAQGNIYNYIKTGFCNQMVDVYGVKKTMYPLVAWTYPSESASPAGLYSASNPSGIQYSSSSILPNHCYPILGIFEPTISGSTAHYIVLGTTFGQ